MLSQKQFNFIAMLCLWLNLADIITTQTALALNGTELNPLFREGYNILNLPFKIFSVLIFILLVIYIHNKTLSQNRKILKAVLMFDSEVLIIVFFSIYLITVINNLNVIYLLLS